MGSVARMNRDKVTHEAPGVARPRAIPRRSRCDCSGSPWPGLQRVTRSQTEACAAPRPDHLLGRESDLEVRRKRHHCRITRCVSRRICRDNASFPQRAPCSTCRDRSLLPGGWVRAYHICSMSTCLLRVPRLSSLRYVSFSCVCSSNIPSMSLPTLPYGVSTIM